MLMETFSAENNAYQNTELLGVRFNKESYL